MAISTSTRTIEADAPDRRWQAFRPDIVIPTERLALRPIGHNDVYEIAEHADDWLVARETPSMPYPYTIETAKTWISAAIGARRRGTDHIFVIRDHAQNRLLGVLGFQIEDQSAEIGYWLGRSHWGNGFATEAVAGALAYAKTELGIQGFRARVFADNVSSIKVLTKLGFVKSREERKFFSNRGGFRRVVSMVHGIDLGEPSPPPMWQRLYDRLAQLMTALGAGS
jgi:RimJ/RimL family protein N-acetyltransferase